MKRLICAFIALNSWLLTGSPGFAATGDELAKKFANPPETAGPQTWWHWMSGNITKEGITADLEAMKRVGIHGAEIFNVSEGIPDGPAPFMSPQWLELFRHAAAEADRLGMELCFHNCAGWSSSGGPWTKPENAMQTVVTSETQIKGGIRFEGTLTQPPTKAGYYRDIAVLAFPTPSSPTKVDKLGPKGLFGFDYEYGMQPNAKSIPAGAIIAKDQIIDLTSKLSADGKLTWEVPAGNWTVLRVGHTPTGKDNHPAPEAGRGLECDKLSREALDAHWAAGIDPILKKLGPLAGKSLNNCLIDSYEVGCNNWSPKFREEFMKRRGYDPIPFLPALAGRYVEGGEITERFLWDLRRTVGDLFAENYYGYFCDLCKKNGLMSSIEPYDGPFECLQVGGKASILMGEFWAGGGESSSVKLAATVAHTHGIRIVGAESFTADPDNGKWLNHPGSLKALGDLNWSSGLNRLIFHCYAHQPWGDDKIPGMTMGQWGTHFGRNNTWWEQSRPWIAYITRSQYLLQEGRCVADVLYFGGEAAPNSGVYHPDLKDRGYDYDAIGTDLIGALTVKGNLVQTPVGGSYRVLVFPETTWMTPAMVKQVGKLAAAGATIIAPKPTKSPSLANYPACDTETSTLADQIWGSASGDHVFGKGHIISGKSVDVVLADLKYQPDFKPMTEGVHFVFIHRAVDSTDLYFVSNQRNQPQTAECAFRVTGRAPELWDAETGKITPAPIWHVQDGRTFVTLNLPQAGSVFVVFRNPASNPGDAIAQVNAQMTPVNSRPLPKLTVTRAVYGAFALTDMADVTAKLAEHVQNGKLQISGAFNSLVGDPAPGVVKELRVEYELDGKAHYIAVPENRALTLPAAGETGTLRITRAVYGKFDQNLKGLPAPLKTIDVTSKLAARIHNNVLDVRIDNALAGTDPAFLVPKELHLEYTVDGAPQVVSIKENEQLRLPEDAWSMLPPEPRVGIENGQLTLTSAQAGTVTGTTVAGGKKSATIGSVPQPIDINGPWDVSFTPGRGAPAKATFEKLVSWPAHSEFGIKYFSGTATYRKTITIPAEVLKPGQSLELDLGRVGIIAEVWLNGKNLGTLWKGPFRVNLGDAAKAGDNELEVRVTNLWVNRLIGDEQFEDDCEWNGITIKRWPDWMVQGKPRTSTNRVTFTTWKHWHKDSSLQPSGLIGPVVLRTYVSAPMK